jgi:hypothetical protein
MASRSIPGLRVCSNPTLAHRATNDANDNVSEDDGLAFQGSGPRLMAAEVNMEFEKLGVFYLGRRYDVPAGELQDQLVMYDARDLTTHGVCVGMTGSGKTGLCIGLLEEAAIDGVPAIILDPKGDITNLLLSFPELKPEDFLPWVNPDDARRKGMEIEDFAASQAELWRKGLADWGQDGDRIRSLRDAADFAIYTPGSPAGIPVSVLGSLAAPRASWETDAEHLRERIAGLASGLLGLIGLEADPARSREHVLLANLIEHYWRQGYALDLPTLIGAIANPPVRQLGAFDIDTFYPEKDRLELAMGLNTLIASPSFKEWLEGVPLDIPALLATADGKPRHSVFYIAHLSDAERMFFVTLQPARPRLHGRGVRLPAAGGRAAEQATVPHPAEAGPGLWCRSPRGHAESRGSGLQGAQQRRHLVHRKDADRTGQAAGLGRPRRSFKRGRQTSAKK